MSGGTLTSRQHSLQLGQTSRRFLTDLGFHFPCDGWFAPVQREGLGIEDVGVSGVHVDLTYDDLFNANVDLLRRCISLL